VALIYNTRLKRTSLTDKKQLNCDKFHNVKHKTLVHITPRPQAQGQKRPPRQKPPFSLSLQTVSLVQGIVGKDKSTTTSDKSRQQVHKVSWPVADPGRAEVMRM